MTPLSPAHPAAAEPRIERASPVQVLRFGPEGFLAAADVVAAEAPLEIRVEGRPVAVVMRTPGHDEELAVGFLLSEGVIARAEDVFEVSTCPSQADGGRAVDVLLRMPDGVDFARLTRHVFSASSCGICGKAVADSIFQQFPPLSVPPDTEPRPSVSARCLTGLPDRLRANQAVFDRTGGLHAAALFTVDGEILAVQEDVGRHNAVDKLIGWACREGRLPLDQHILVLSGRIAFELVQKALAARIPIIAAISAPTSLAVSFAESAGMTLCGFVRGGGMNVYSHAWRIAEGTGATPWAVQPLSADRSTS
jgi:FdhD protein